MSLPPPLMPTAIRSRPCPSPPDQGQSSIVSGRLRYRPNGGTGGPGVVHQVPFRIRDLTAATGLQSSSIALVTVTTPVVVTAAALTTALGAAARGRSSDIPTRR